MYKIQTYNSLAAKGLDRFSPGKYHVGPEESDADALMLRLSLIHISEPTRPSKSSRMPSSA